MIMLETTMISRLILRIIIMIIVLGITSIINYIYCRNTNKKFTIGQFILIFSIILLCSLPMYFIYVM